MNLHLFSSNCVQDCGNKIAIDVILSPDIIASTSDIVLLTFVVVNMSEEPLANIDLIVDESLFSGEPYATTLSPSFLGDPNDNGFLDPGEVWFYTAVKSYDYEQGDVFIISGATSAEANCGEVSSGAGKLLFTVIENNALIEDPFLAAEYASRIQTKNQQGQIFPNPAPMNAVVNIPLPSNMKSELVLMNAMGQIIRKIDIEDRTGSYLSYNTGGLAPGIYFAQALSPSANTFRLEIY